MAYIKGKKVAVGGNLGIPVLYLSRYAKICAIKFSSFHLELINEIDLDITALVSVTSDRIYRHDSKGNKHVI